MLHPAIAKRIFSQFQMQKGMNTILKETQILTDREMKVLKLGACGLSNKEVAKKFSLGIRTVQTHWRNIFNKLGVSTRTEALIYGLQKGWISIEKTPTE